MIVPIPLNTQIKFKIA